MSEGPQSSHNGLWFVAGLATALGVSVLKNLILSRSSASKDSCDAPKQCHSAPAATATSDATSVAPKPSGCPFSGHSRTPATTTAAPVSSSPPAASGCPYSTPASATGKPVSATTTPITALVRPKRGSEPVHYHSYLQLDKILGAQLPKSLEVGGVAAHDEMLFIIIHQAHELWFKQIIHDLNSLRAIMSPRTVEESTMGKVLERLNRITKIQRLLVDSLPVLETMTPLSFLEFREYLFPASGFQSMQFRTFEVLLGLRRKARSQYAGAQYDCVLRQDQADSIRELEGEASLFELLDAWLARNPLLSAEGFDFWQQYQEAVDKMFKEEEDDLVAQVESGSITEVTRSARLRDIASQRSFFRNFFDADTYEAARQAGTYRLSYRATQAALMINFYQEEPLFQAPYQLLSLLIDVDQNLAAWRSKHAAMVHRMLGVKMGTGGSSGYAYLLETVNQHRIFSELANIASLMVPRGYLPPLPDHIKASAAFTLTRLRSSATESAASTDA